MKNIHISYDLFAPDQNYAKVIEKIKSLGGWAKIHKSYWFLKTNLTAPQVRDAVWSVMDSNDSLYVVDSSSNEAAWKNIDPKVSKYISDNWLAKAA